MRSKIIPLVAILFLAIGQALAQNIQSAAADTAAYLTARNRYIVEYKSRPADSQMDRPLADLERRLRTIIPPWQSPGFPTEGRINLSTLQHDLGFGMLDGLRYQANGTTVIVTTPALVRNWIADHNGQWSGADAIPEPVDAAIRSGGFWTFAHGEDNGWGVFGEVPVKIPGGTGAALLTAPTQTGYIDEGPKELFVAVLRSDRAFVASQKLATGISRQPVCERQLRSDTTGHADVDFQACFAPHLHEQPQYDAIQKQAQALVNLLR